jgi:hypothetical protein
MDKKELWMQLRHYYFEHVVNPGLFDRIAAKFDHANPSYHAFAHKIARKHGWKTGFALKALNEYKKFVFLGLVSDFQVTPSKIIDVVWHEHLLFSKAYRDFCEQVIRQPFDHYPELVPMEDQTGRFSAQYLDTLALYKKEFDLDPPADIWGDAKFDKEQVKRNGYQSKKKEYISDSGISYDSTPLYTHFDAEPAASFPEFSGFGDGDAGGGGASGDFSDGSDSGGDSGGDGGGCSGGCGGGD